MKRIVAYKGYYAEFMAKLSEEKDCRLQGVLCGVHGKVVRAGEEEDNACIAAV